MDRRRERSRSPFPEHRARRVAPRRADCLRRSRRGSGWRFLFANVTDERVLRHHPTTARVTSDRRRWAAVTSMLGRTFEAGRSRAVQSKSIGAVAKSATYSTRVEEGGLCPVQVVEDDDKRTSRRERLEVASGTPTVSLLWFQRRRRARSPRRPAPRRDHLRSPPLSRRSRNLAVERDDLRKRPVRDAFAVCRDSGRQRSVLPHRADERARGRAATFRCRAARALSNARRCSRRPLRVKADRSARARARGRRRGCRAVA